MDNKVTVLEIIRASSVLSKVSKQAQKSQDKNMEDMALPFYIAKAIKSMEPDLLAFESAKDKISERYRNENKVYESEDDSMLRVLPQFMTDYQHEVESLTFAEVDKPNFSFKFSVLVRNYSLTAEDWIQLMPWIIDDSDSVISKD